MLKSIVNKVSEKRLSFLYRKKHLWSADKVVSSPFEDVTIPDVTIQEHIWSNLHKWSHKNAVVCGITDRKYTYLELYRKSQSLGASFRKIFNIKDGDCIAVMLPNMPEYPIVVLGILTSGGIVTTLNPIYTALNKVLEKRLRFLYRKKHLWSADKVVSSPFEDVTIPDVTIQEHIWSNLHKWSHKNAVVCGITDRKYTYLELYRQSQSLGATFRKIFNIKDGDCIAVMLPNMPEYPIVVLGILTSGGIVTTLNPIYTAYEVQKQLASSDVKIVIASAETAPVIKRALELNQTKIPIIVVDVSSSRPNDTVSYKELVNNTTELGILKEVKRNCKDVSLLLFSSGTTGLPKGVELTHRNIVANSVQQDHEEVRHYNITTESNQDILLAYLPMFHSYGISVMMLHKLSVGLKLITLPKFQPNTFVNVLENHKINLMYLVPPTVLFLGSSPEVKARHLENLMCAATGGAPSPSADVERFLNKVEHELRFNQVYGLTETSPLATISPVGFKNYTSVGFAVSNIKLRIVDENSNNLGPNELGELLIKGPNIMKGYKNNPEANAQVFLEDGWFRSGDHAKIDEDGCLTIADRLKELIKVNAYQVAPAELESVIKDHPAVFDVAVIGIPDSKTGEKPKAFVVLNKGVNTDGPNIMEFVRERVAPYKHIKEINFIESIPKNPSGKILRRVLLEKHLKNI